MAETVAVTGGAGFIGSHVVDKLVEAGFQVEVIDDLSTGRRENLPEGVGLHQLDIRSEEIRPIMARLKPVSVVHLAAQIDVRRSLKEPKLDAEINVVGGLNVAAAAMAAGCNHLVFASSAATYGVPKEIPIPEDHSQQPADHYGVSKLAFEHYLRVFQEVNGLRPAILRFANVYGPRQTVKGEAGVVAIFIKKLLNGQPPTVHGDGEQTRDYVYVGDVAEMTARAVKDRLKGIYNVSTGQETSVNEIAERLRQLAGSDLGPEHGPPVPNENRRCSLSPEKAISQTGWKPQVDLAEGLAKTVEFAKNDPAFKDQRTI